MYTVIRFIISVTLLTLTHMTCEHAASCSKSWDVRLYSGYSYTPETEGTVQYCYSGTWYSVCDYNWGCADGNVVCQQLGLGKARECNMHTQVLQEVINKTCYINVVLLMLYVVHTIGKLMLYL